MSKRDKQIEKIKAITNMEKDLLGSLYDDLFGSSLTDLRKKKTADEKPDIKDEPDTKEVISSAEDTIKMADDALKEARELFGDVKLQQQLEEAKTEAQAAPEEPETDPMEELDALVGLTTIKHDVKELTDFVRIQKLRKEQGLKSVPVSLHLVFTGNPGTVKTTVARILARIYKKIGVLSKGQLIEVDRSGLVAGYVGQTALKTQEKIKAAMGGILFIDEAYALARKDDTFGQEAIDTILKAMEDHRDDFVVIVAGYTGPMEYFINSNPGLKSRFNKYIEFPDYTLEELEKIFYQNCERYDYVVADEAKDPIRAMIISRKATKIENFANAREVRNMFEEIITNQARRVAKLENPAQEEIMTITLSDLSDLENDHDSEAASLEPGAEEKETSTENDTETEAVTAADTEDENVNAITVDTEEKDEQDE